MVEAVSSSLLSNGEGDMFGHTVEQEIPTFFSRKKVKKVFGWGGVWGEEVCCLFSQKEEKEKADYRVLNCSLVIGANIKVKEPSMVHEKSKVQDA